MIAAGAVPKNYPSQTSHLTGAISYTYLETSIGSLLLTAGDSGLQSVLFPKNGRPAAPDPAWQQAFVRGVTESLRHGVDGWLHEGLVLERNWDEIDVERTARTKTSA